MTKIKTHTATQREDGSVFCKCPNLQVDENASVSLNYKTNKMICSVCGTDVKEK